MLSDAFALALLTVTGFMFIYKKLPRKIRKFLEKYSLLTDFVSAVLTYMLLGGTLTALTASALVGIFTSCLLYIAQNPDDFTYLWDFAEGIKTMLSRFQLQLKAYGKQYREAKVMQEMPRVN